MDQKRVTDHRGITESFRGGETIPVLDGRQLIPPGKSLIYVYVYLERRTKQDENEEGKQDEFVGGWCTASWDKSENSYWLSMNPVQLDFGNLKVYSVPGRKLNSPEQGAHFIGVPPSHNLFAWSIGESKTSEA